MDHKLNPFIIEAKNINKCHKEVPWDQFVIGNSLKLKLVNSKLFINSVGMPNKQTFYVNC